jgi:HPt (histidine-containing phosphotransfer) domain-containing protein
MENIKYLRESVHRRRAQHAAIIKLERSKTMWHPPEELQEIEEAGSDGIVLELIDSFQTDVANRFKRLHEAVARLDAATVKVEAHTIRGSAGQMGAEALAALCQAVEAGVPEMSWPDREYQLNQAEARFAEVNSAMDEYVEARRRDDGTRPSS